MPRLRHTLEEMKTEAIRLASEFVDQLPGTKLKHCKGVVPDGIPSSSSKHPVQWVVIFVFHQPDEIVDGCELIVRVNVENNDVSLCD